MISPFSLSLTISILPHSEHELFGESSVIPIPSLLSSSVLVDIIPLVPSNRPESLEGSGSLGGGGCNVYSYSLLISWRHCNVEFLNEFLVPVPYGYLSDSSCHCDITLGDSVVCEDTGDVN